MIIHVVQPGETVYSIANIYGISVTRLIHDNGLTTRGNLVVGETLVILYPVQTHTVLAGESLQGIADKYDVTLIQLLRNNPHLSESKELFPGEIIVISYNNTNGIISTIGYAYPFIDKETLRKTLPFLTYLDIFNYRITADGNIVTMEDDTEIIQIAKDYGVAPMMLLSTLTAGGDQSFDVSYHLLSSQEFVDRHIEEILTILKTKGYYGLNMSFEYINDTNYQIYNYYITKVSTRLEQEGYLVGVTLSPRLLFDINVLTFERIDYSLIGQRANDVMILSYNWGYSYGPPAAVTTVFTIRGFLNYAVELIEPAKMYIGIPITGYDWELPYIIGRSRASALSINSSLEIASEVDATIQFEERALAPYFEYVDISEGIPKQHIAWFVDARTIDAIARLVLRYGLKGLGSWNIMQYFSQMWMVLNSQYQIEKVLPEVSPSRG